MTANSQLLTTTPKTKTRAKQANNQNRKESQKWRSHGGLSTGEWERERDGKGIDNKEHKWQVENRQGEGKNSIGYGEAKELICMTHVHELKGGECGQEGECRAEGSEGGKWDNCNTIINKIYCFKNPNVISQQNRINYQICMEP